MSEATEIERQASDWIARLDRAGISGGGRGEEVLARFAAADSDFARWIEGSIERRVAFLRLHAAWTRADRLAALTPAASVRPPRRRRAGTVGLVAGTIAASLLLAAVMALVAHLDASGDPQVYETAVGGHETVPLADGSTIELNTDTRVLATLSKRRRAVVLERGEAYFDVASGDTRPFVVEAGTSRVTVLGTEFAVRRVGDEVKVVVTEGRVKVEGSEDAPEQVATVADEGALVLARADGALVRRKSREELAAELGWRHGLLIFDQMALSEVAAEFNRYNHLKLVIADETAAGIRIGGSFRARNIEAFARLLEEGLGLRVVRRDGRLVVTG